MEVWAAKLPQGYGFGGSAECASNERGAWRELDLHTRCPVWLAPKFLHPATPPAHPCFRTANGLWTMNETATQLEQLASRAVTLYTRPTVALQLVELAEDPTADAKALKECVSQDPALACKLLRVVNSSLYGLHRPVADLNQAIGLLGIKPLKLLVLGFNLPDTLFAEVAARELEWYWTNTLTRAVAARMLSEQLWRLPGDEAFIAGLLQDIGILVLLRELGEPYARFLTGVIHEKCNLATLEQDTLGFDHVQLSAALLARWQLPQRLVSAIEVPQRTARLARMSSPEADLPQILHLAELLMQLVGQHRLGVLGELLEAGRLYRGLTRSKLVSLVEGLQPQVDQLAEVLAVELAADRDYVGVLVKAQKQMGVLGEQIAADAAAGDDDEIYGQLLAHTGELTDAMQSFLGRKRKPNAAEGSAQKHAAHYGQHRARGFVGRAAEGSNERGNLVQSLTSAATRCRERRQELSLLVVECGSGEAELPLGMQAAHDGAICTLVAACEAANQERPKIVPLADGRVAVVLMDCERRTALAISHDAIREFGEHSAADESNRARVISIGVATVSAVPKNFDAGQLVESAVRCLTAARAGGISAVKSIEV